MEWDGWSPAARNFLERQGRAVALTPIIKRHGAIVVELNAWLRVALAQANVDDLAEVNEIVTERNALLGRMSMEAARNVTAETTMRRETRRATPWSAARPAPAEATETAAVGG